MRDTSKAFERRLSIITNTDLYSNFSPFTNFNIRTVHIIEAILYSGKNYSELARYYSITPIRIRQVFLNSMRVLVRIQKQMIDTSTTCRSFDPIASDIKTDSIKAAKYKQILTSLSA